MTDSKNIDNPVGQGGGQRKRLSRSERQNNNLRRNLDRQGAADRKAQLVRKTREKYVELRTPDRRATTPHRADAPPPQGGTARGRAPTAARGPDPAAASGLCCRTGCRT